MALSFVEYQGDGITKVFAVPFDYIYRDDVKVTLNGQPATFSWLSPNSISLSTAPTSAQLLKIERDTEKQTALVDFKNDSVLDEALLDLMWKQVFMIIQEAQDQSDVSFAVSDNARSIATEAKGIAQTAETKADTAIATANGAVVTANSAVSTANAATSTANGAVVTANNAVSTAGSAQNTANAAVATANSAVTTANEAKATANSANTTALQATATANQAQNTANQALERAINAETSASTAQGAAQTAQSAAEAAAADAEAANASAEQAKTTTEQIKQDVQAITGADFTDFAKNSENLAALTDKTAARSNLGLGNVDNTSDLQKPISTAVQEALDYKVTYLEMNDALQTKADVQALEDGLAVKADNQALIDGLATKADKTALQSFQTQVADQLALKADNTALSAGLATKLDTGATAAAATKLATARTINGVSFNGTANITIEDATKLPLTGGYMTGVLYTGQVNAVMAASNSSASLEVRGGGGTGDSGMAMISFHCPGHYATKLGLRSDGYFGLGGWSSNVWRWYVDPSGNMVAAGNVTAYSDIRLKTDIEVIPKALEKVQTLRGVTYTRLDSGERQTGLIAQEVQKVLPEAVVDGEHLSVAYGNMVGLLIEAIKELKAELDAVIDEQRRVA